GVASDYPELRLAAPGRRIVRVCAGVACLARGGREVLAACERRLGIGPGQTTADGAFTLEEFDCAFACGSAPVVEVDHGYHGRVTTSDLDAMLATPGERTVAPATGRGGAPATVPATGSPGARFTALKREAEGGGAGASGGGGPAVPRRRGRLQRHVLGAAGRRGVARRSRAPDGRGGD